MAGALHAGKNAFQDSLGAPLASGRLYTYVAGTSTPKAAYQNVGLSNPHANPIVLDSRGEAEIYWSGTYDVTLKTAADVTIWGPVRLEAPDASGAAAAADVALRAELLDPTTAGDGDAMIGWSPIYDIRDGVLTRHSTLAAAVTAIGSTRCDVVVRDDVTMAANASFPATCTVHTTNRAQITTTGFTLTFGAKPRLHPGQNFAGTGTTVFTDGVEGPGFLPQWWGAKPDGTTDNTTAIQSCITAAEASSVTAGGTVIYFAPGASYYRTTAVLTVNASGITLQGGGAGSSIYNNGTGNCLDVGDNVTNRSDVHIVELNLQAGAASSIALRARMAPNIRIDKCNIANYGTAGDGIRLTDSFCASIMNCTFGSIRGYGIHATSSANATTIIGNRLDGNSIAATCGIYIDGAGNTVKGNTVETWATCINGRGERGSTFSSNYFETYVTGYLFDASGAEGVNIEGGYYAATGSTVSIKITAGSGFSIRGGSFVGTHSGGAPIELSTGPSNVFIYPGMIHDDAYSVKWPTNHIELGHHLLSDNLYPAAPGYLALVTHTGTVAETTLKSYTGVKEHLGVGSRIRVRAAGRCVNTNGTKDVRLKLDGTTIATIAELAAAQDDWIIEANIDIQSATVATGSVLGFQGAAVEVFDVLNSGVTIALSTTNPVVIVTGQLGNTADTITLSQWEIQVVN